MSLPKRSLLALVAMTLSGATHPPLTGEWGGDRARLILSATGGTLERDCGSGTIKGPLRLDAHHGFKAKGTFETYAPGPMPADAPPRLQPTLYSGTVNGDAMMLTVKVKGTAEPMTLHLVRGKRIKVIRCF